VENVELRRQSFNQVAKLYDEIRPGYPDALIQDVVKLSGLPADGRILEIGCGTGQATLPFARRGYDILGLELGDRLAARAARNCRECPKVRILHTAFEDWPAEPRSFNLVMSATAFHWITPEFGYPRTAEVLKRDGSLALFWNFQPRPENDFFRELQAVYRREVPELAQDKSFEQRIEERAKQFDASRLFQPATVRRYPWQSRLTTDQYIKALSTQSNHIILEPAVRKRLFTAIRELIERLGGTVAIPMLSVLFIGRKRKT
jgi:SAM-dependent methyltransferase